MNLETGFSKGGRASTESQILAALLFGLLICAILPAHIVAVNDDFGYLRSVVETIKHGRPWTDDWLEPWAASFSIFSAVIFRATGNFYLATYGLLSALAAVSFGATAALLKNRGFGVRPSMAIAGLILTCATVLWKSLEFTSVAIYLPCFLTALWASERRRWLLFLVVWLVGMAARQSAVTWIVLPVFECFRAASIKKTTRQLKRSAAWAGTSLAGFGSFLLLHRYMNATHAQALITDRALQSLQIGNSVNAIKTGVAVFLAGIGLGAFCRLIRPGDRIVMRKPLWIMISITAISIYLLSVDERRWVGIEHLCYDDLRGWLYLKALVIAAATGWSVVRFKLRLPCLGLALASLGALSIRAPIWDYYCLELGLLGLLAVDSAATGEAVSGGERLARGRFAAAAMLFVLGLFHLSFVLEFKCDFDRDSAVCGLAERALRDGKIAAEDISFAPFGFTGWYWDHYYIAHEGKADPNLAGFGKYLSGGKYGIGQSYSPILHILRRFRHTAPADQASVIERGAYRYLWLFRSQFYLVRLPNPAVAAPVIAVKRSEMPAEPFPLSNEEWRALITRAASGRRPSPRRSGRSARPCAGPRSRCG